MASVPPIGERPSVEHDGFINLSELQHDVENPTKAQNTSGVKYLFSNELGRDVTLHFLTPTTNPKSIHLGFSGYFNFDIIAATKPKYGVICDIDPAVCEIIRRTGELIKTTENKEEFIHALATELSSDEDEYYYYEETMLPIAEILKKEIIRPHSWLSNDKNFLTIKQMFKEERIRSFILDMKDHESFQKFNIWLKQNELSVDSMYVTNIHEWLQEKRELYCRNVTSIASEDTRIIYAWRETFFSKQSLRQEIGSPIDAKCLHQSSTARRRKRKRWARSDENSPQPRSRPLFGEFPSPPSERGDSPAAARRRRGSFDEMSPPSLEGLESPFEATTRGRRDSFDEMLPSSLEGLESPFEATTRGRRDSFDEMLPSSLEGLESSPAPS